MKPKRQKKLRLNVDVDTQDQKGEPLHIPASSEVFRASALVANDWLQTIIQTHKVVSPVTVQVVHYADGEGTDCVLAVLPDQLYETDL